MNHFIVSVPKLPETALLGRYAHQGYTDCFSTRITGNHDLAGFVAAFYTTWLFKAERMVLRVLLKTSSTDQDAARLARGDTEHFAVWRQEERTAHQLLMCPDDEKTRSWLMVEANAEHTVLYFGSALLTGTEERHGLVLRAVIRLHRIYSKALLALARRKLDRAA